MNAIQVNKLSKCFPNGKKALDKLSLSLEEGAIFGFLGPNGAGKTTTIKLLTGMLSPSEGSCHVFDINPAVNPEKVHLFSGVITEHAQMYDHFTGLQNLVFYGTLFGMDRSESSKRAVALLEDLHLSEVKDQKLATYSTGMRQRLSLARAIIHRPRILFLDEPTSGLDPESAQNVNNLIKSLAKEKGTTIFLCTHQLRYAQEICTHYGLIDEGVMLASGTIEELRSLIFSSMTVTIKADRYPNNLKLHPDEQGYCEISVQSEEEIPLLVKHIIEAGGNIYHVSAQRMSLEEIYFSLIELRKKNKEVAI